MLRLSSSRFVGIIGLPRRPNFLRLLHTPSPKPPLKENIWTIPNALTITRLAAAPVIGYLVVKHQYSWAVGLMIYASVTDFVDGYLARKYKNYTVFGSIADPAADKALMVTLASCLTISGAVPWWCGLSILGRDAALALTALIVRYKTLPPPKTFKRYSDFSLPSVQVTPTTISKWNTFFQMVYLTVCLANPVLPIVPIEVQNAMAVLVTGTTWISGLSYVFSKNAVKKL